MYIPKIVVNPMDITQNVELIAKYVDPSFNRMNKSRPFADKTYKLYPKLIGLIKEDMTYDEVLQIVTPIVEQELKDSKDMIDKRIAYFRDEFNKFSDELMIELLNLFEVTWEDGKDIECFVGYIPFYPRSVVDKVFYVSYADEERVFRGAAHEINHFVFFDKWKQLYGYKDGEEPMHPEPLWFTEEMIVDPTLNTNRILEITGYNHFAYEQFYTEYINGKIVMDYVKEFYEESNTIKEFIDKTYEFSVNNIQELLEKCG